LFLVELDLVFSFEAPSLELLFEMFVSLVVVFTVLSVLFTRSQCFQPNSPIFRSSRFLSPSSAPSSSSPSRLQPSFHTSTSSLSSSSGSSAFVSSTASSSSISREAYSQPRVSILTEIDDHPGSLYEILKFFWKHDINLTHIESRPSNSKCSTGFHVQINFDGSIGTPATDALLKDLQYRCKNMLILDEKEVPWFPRHISELDLIAARVLDAGSDLQSDHPGKKTLLVCCTPFYLHVDFLP
jgi:hypothetical protein